MLNILFFASFLALVVASIPLWWSAIMQKRATGMLMENRESSGTPLGLLDVIVMFFFWVVGQMVSIFVITSIFGITIDQLGSAPGDTMSWATILMASGQLIATFLAIGVFMLRYRRPSIVGWQPDQFRCDLGIGLGAFAMVVPTILFLQWLLVLVFDYQHPTMELLAKNANGLTLLATWFSAVVGAPICEELFFRGVLQSWLQRLGRGSPDHVLTGGWDSQSVAKDLVKVTPDSGSLADPVTPSSRNPYEPPNPVVKDRALSGSVPSSWISDTIWPILVTSVLFGLAHMGQGPAPIPLFVFGIALGYVFRRTGSIVPCIVLHMMLNAFSMFWFTLQVFFGEPMKEAVVASVRNAIGLV